MADITTTLLGAQVRDVLDLLAQRLGPGLKAAWDIALKQNHAFALIDLGVAAVLVFLSLISLMTGWRLAYHKTYPETKWAGFGVALVLFVIAVAVAGTGAYRMLCPEMATANDIMTLIKGNN